MTTAPPGTERLVSVDLLRGLVMVLMALDHTRDFFTSLKFPPEDVTQTWGALFFTRWITHYCAPVFFFLAGTGAFLYGTRGRPTRQIGRFLWTRGLWLVALEFSIVGFGWTFVVPSGFGGVLWALGWTMVAMSLVVRLPQKWIGPFGIAMIVSHNLLDHVQPAQLGKMGWLWTILHRPGLIPIHPPIGLFILYPLVPWIGVMAAGYALGALWLKPREERRRRVFLLGLAMTLGFVVLRGGNLYGNPVAGEAFVSPGAWRAQKSLVMTVVSFLDVEKYPPSLQFLLMTLGPALMLLALLERFYDGRTPGALGRFFHVFGRVPMFYYVSHIYLIHLLAFGVAVLCRQPAAWLLHGGFMLGGPPDGYGHQLPFIYLMWVTGVLALYLPCRWFAGVRQRRKDWWLSYL